MQLSGDFVMVGNVSVHTRRIAGKIRSQMISKTISTMPSDLQVYGVISHSCPKHFNILEKHNYFTFNGDQIHMSFSLFCITCPINQYTLGAGKIDIFPFRDASSSRELKTERWRQNLVVEKCMKCPPGARCNGNIIPMDNHWGYRVSATKMIFTPCPTGYCCSVQTTIHAG